MTLENSIKNGYCEVFGVLFCCGCHCGMFINRLIKKRRKKKKNSWRMAIVVKRTHSKSTFFLNSKSISTKRTLLGFPPLLISYSFGFIKNQGCRMKELGRQGRWIWSSYYEIRLWYVSYTFIRLSFTQNQLILFDHVYIH